MDAIADRQPFRLGQSAELVGLTAEPDDQHGSEVGMARIPGYGAAKQIDGLAVAACGATIFVRQRDHAIDIGKVAQPLPPRLLGDHARDPGRAVHRR